VGAFKSFLLWDFAIFVDLFPGAGKWLASAWMSSASMARHLVGLILCLLVSLALFWPVHGMIALFLAVRSQLLPGSFDPILPHTFTIHFV
jgi:hypothetical protein